MIKKKKILVAEDEIPVAKVFSIKLESAGYDVEVASNGLEAIQKTKETQPDLVLLDLMMPIKDGFTVLQEMAQEDINVPVIVASNLDDEKDLTRAKRLGARQYLVKAQMGADDVVRAVDALLAT